MRDGEWACTICDMYNRMNLELKITPRTLSSEQITLHGLYGWYVTVCMLLAANGHVTFCSWKYEIILGRNYFSIIMNYMI